MQITQLPKTIALTPLGGNDPDAQQDFINNISDFLSKLHILVNEYNLDSEQYVTKRLNVKHLFDEIFQSIDSGGGEEIIS